jgi:hypothetical protein
MINENEILKRMLLNMRYNSKMTLQENYNHILSEQQKKPSASAGELTTVGVVADVPTTDSGFSIVKTKTFDNKNMSFYGIIDKTIQQKIDEYINAINQKGEDAYRESEIYGTKVSYVGPEWGRSYYKAYKENKMSLDDFKKKFGATQVLKYEEKVESYVYKKDTLGYVASRCRSSLKEKVKDEAVKKNIRYSREIWYEEPNGVKECVKTSIQDMFKNFNKTSPFSFFAYNPKTKNKDFFFFHFSCSFTTEDSLATYQGKQFGSDETVMREIPSTCNSSTIKISGYKTTDGLEWEKLKIENENLVKQIELKNNSTGTNREQGAGDLTGSSETGTEIGQPGGDGTYKIFLTGGSEL